MISTVITAIIAFVGTNIDDIFVLMLLFAQANETAQLRSVVIGQYLGIGALSAVSIAAAIGVSMVSQVYIGFLGFVPILMGAREIATHLKSRAVAQVRPEAEEAIRAATGKSGVMNTVSKIMNPNTAKAFVITFANGGDNLGIYILLFADMVVTDIIVTVTIFLLLTSIWCFAGYKLSIYPAVEKQIKKYKQFFVPVVFIGIGIMILVKSGTFDFVYRIIRGA